MTVEEGVTIAEIEIETGIGTETETETEVAAVEEEVFRVAVLTVDQTETLHQAVIFREVTFAIIATSQGILPEIVQINL